MTAAGFDAQRAKLNGPDFFPRLSQDKAHQSPLRDAKLADGAMVLVFSRGEAVIALDKPDMVVHHCAQGELDGQPWVVSF